jgi:hypothetical protein
VNSPTAINNATTSMWMNPPIITADRRPKIRRVVMDGGDGPLAVHHRLLGAVRARNIISAGLGRFAAIACCTAAAWALSRDAVPILFSGVAKKMKPMMNIAMAPTTAPTSARAIRSSLLCRRV